MPRLARFTFTLLCLVAFLTPPISAIPALAATLTVTKTADTNDGTCDSDCSLREAIAASDSGDTITFDSSLSGGTIHLASTLTLSRTLTIDGSALASQITLSGDSDNNGTGNVQVLQINTSGVKVPLNSLIIAKGSSPSPIEGGGGGLLITSGTTAAITNSTFSGNSAILGGGLSNYGTLTISDSTFSGNSTPAGGGLGAGLFNNSVLTITNSTFSNNSAPGSGSGGGLVNSGPALIANSTFSGNSAGEGGGIYGGQSLTIINSTFSGNSALKGGGLLFASGTLTITNSTFSGNSATSVCCGGGITAAGLYIFDGTVNLANTIIANSTGMDCWLNNPFPGMNTNTNNLIEDGSCSAALSGDPNLGALADNGGPTQTFALLTGSSAIDAGDDTTCAASPINNLDQRGVTRPIGAHCDIGAYEYNSAPSVIAFTATSPSTSLNIPITTFTASDDVAVTGYQITESSTPPSAGASGWTGSAPSTYTVGSDGAYTLSPWAKDAAGNVSSVYGSPASVTVDTASPTVTINQGASQVDPTSVSPIVFAVVFSEAVTGFTNADVTISGMAATPGITVLGSGTTYTVTVTGMVSGETITATIPAGATKDGAGNDSLTSTSTDNSVTYKVITLTVIRTGNGNGTVTGTGVSCGIDCSETFAASTVITLTATANTGSTFFSWSGPCAGIGVCPMTLSASQTITATFKLEYKIFLPVIRKP